MSVFDYKKALENVPHKPGVYQFFDEAEKLIYIGKAKDLRNRVGSYFNKDGNQQSGKTRMLVSKIRNIHFTIVDSEIDARLLENSMIKKHQPKYNVELKDDKTFPSLVIKNENYPRIFGTRRIIRDGSTYFGPYGSIPMMRTVLELVKELYPLRTCNLNLSPENINAGKFKVCLEYQIGNCKGPCQNYQSEDDYSAGITAIKEILKGNISKIVSGIKAQLHEASDSMDFESAYRFKRKIDLLEKYQGKSTIVSTSIDCLDVFSIASEEKYAFVNFMRVAKGTITQTQTIEIKKKLDESDAELLIIAIEEFQERFGALSKELIVPIAIEFLGKDQKITIPQMGEKKKLLDLSHKNALFYKKSKLDMYEKLYPDVKSDRLMNQMQEDLRLTAQPRHIECFDNSNFQGKYPVSAMVLFRDGKPARKEYRHYNVKTVIGPNDFDTMEEVVFRRYRRLLDEGSALPDLIIIDGGKGQLSSAMKSLRKLGIETQIPMIGIAKRLEEIYYPGDSMPLYIDKRSETLKIIQHLRDEAHRFGITFHRLLRDKGTLQTELEQVKGIGKTSAINLLKHFRSVKKIREATEDELIKVITKAQVINLLAHFNEKTDQVTVTTHDQENELALAAYEEDDQVTDSLDADSLDADSLEADSLDADSLDADEFGELSDDDI